jgi:hypothetical protein
VTGPAAGPVTGPLTGPLTDAAWEWVDHLRSGGTTPWQEWRGRPASGPHPGGRLLPGAQQLELLRRLNAAGRPGPELVERVLWASAPGRGRSDLELAGAVEPLAFGPAPVDPGALPPVALLRVAVGLLAEDVRAADPGRRDTSRRRWRRSRYRLAGDRWLADPVRSAMATDARPARRGAPVLVVGTDLATLLAHAWLARSFRDGAPPWPDFVTRMRRRRTLPRVVDLAAVAQRWADGVGAQRVRIVVDPAELPRLLGRRHATALPPDVTGEAGELARRVAGALTHLVTAPERPRLMAEVLRPRLEREAAGPAPVVPPQHREWLVGQAERIRSVLAIGGYAVAGDLDLLVPRWEGSSPDRGTWQMSDVLDLALRLLLEPERRP